jgi:hypothetical protein
MPDEVVRQCAAKLLAGYIEDMIQGVDGQWRIVHKQKCYTSIHDAVRRCSFLEEQIFEFGIMEGTLLLLRSLQRVARGLRKRHLHQRKSFPPKCMPLSPELALKHIFNTKPSVGFHQVITKDVQSFPALLRELVAIEGA